MPSRKRIVCRCEDLTEEEIGKAIASGRRDIESLKRLTGIGTGPCQGKSCMSHAVRILAEATGKSPEELGTMRLRPPLQPVEIKVLAAHTIQKAKEERQDVGP